MSPVLVLRIEHESVRRDATTMDGVDVSVPLGPFREANPFKHDPRKLDAYRDMPGPLTVGLLRHRFQFTQRYFGFVRHPDYFTKRDRRRPPSAWLRAPRVCVPARDGAIRYR